jgi:hypothetical protein
MPPATTTRLGGIRGSRPDFTVLTLVRAGPYNGAMVALLSMVQGRR